MPYILNMDKQHCRVMIRHSFNMDVKIWSTRAGQIPVDLYLYCDESRSIG